MNTNRPSGGEGLSPEVEAVTKTVIGAAFEVSNVLGAGFLEVLYRRAMVKELRLRGLEAEEEVRFTVHYKGDDIGTYVADLVVDGCVVVELKALDSLTGAHSAQVLNYLRASGLKVGMLFNFGRPRLEMKRLLL
ncbi:GxxExxY protein [Paramagnetospirillum kuznetsovii]|uniref:GxxExxY protein n=1 Tax=Paramagnetospirillum kuznetsovii TaxID=2053833 RepID=A0A364NTR5_9PROT|nr:GxxExxY protein [Paramagnetospirillum kuznetsovii]RAU20468.1 GxxExxY protein [Paramagnetospirillum kuznetsovii]